MSKRLIALLIVPIAMLSTACAHGGTDAGPAAVSEYCLIAKGIGYAAKPSAATEDARNRFDTDETVASVEEHNLRFEAVCPDRVPKPVPPSG